MWGKNARKLVRALKRNKLLRNGFVVVGLLFLIASLVLVSVTGNVFLHELAHFSVAQHYGLHPEMHITNVVSLLGDEGIRFNANPVAYTTFSNPHDAHTNLYVTFAGPLMNIIISVVLALLYLIVRFMVNKRIKFYLKRDRMHYALRWNTIRFICDVVFVSLLVPSLVSVFVNLSTIPGSDGEAIRSILSNL